MAHTILTLGSGAILRKALASFHNKSVFLKSIDKQYDDRFAVRGAKIGDTLDIRLPNEFTVRTGAVMDVQEVTESMHELQLGTQKGVDINFSSAELLLDMDDFNERIIEPAMSRLAADVEATVIGAEYKKIWNMVFSTVGTGPVIADIQSGRAKLQKGLCPTGDRTALMESLGMNTVVNASKALFAPASEISRQYSQGLVGQLSGFNFYESEMVPNHTNGSRTTVGSMNLATVANGDTHIDISVGAGSEALVAGDIITVAGVYAVNQETKEPYAHLQQIVCRTGVAVPGSAVAVDCYPTLYKSGAKQNVYSADWTTSPAVVNVDTGECNGEHDAIYPQHLLYHKNTFAFVSGDLEKPQGVDFAAREVFDGVSMRIVRQYNINNDVFPCRIDVFFGHTTPRPQWGVRVLGEGTALT